MALEGSLREFNVADILQLIFFQKKTGALMLNGRHDRVRVLFFDGNIVGADSKKRGFDRKLGMLLLKKGLITKEQIEASIDKQRAEGGKFGAVLVREGYITKEQIEQVLTFQITEIMVQVFSMKEGFYEFKPQSIPVDKEAGVVLNTEHFLMEGIRLVDEWSQIEGKITLDDVYMLRDNPPGTSLTEDEQKILKFIDDRSSVADITDVSGVDSYNVSSNILTLAEKGFVYRYEEPKDEIEDIVVKSRDIPGLKAVIYIIAVLALAGSIVTLKLMSAGDIKIYQAIKQVYNIELAVETEYYTTGAYPEREVVEADYVDPWGYYYLYEVREDGFLLMSAGPDEQSGTPDDIPNIYDFFSSEDVPAGYMEGEVEGGKGGL